MSAKNHVENLSTKGFNKLSKLTALQSADTGDTTGMLRGIKGSPVVGVKKVEVGAGANINQKIHDDSESLDFWRDKPESIIYVNYALEEDCLAIINQADIHPIDKSRGF